MSDLAFNLNGDPFDVPSNAVGWRVRKMKNKGAPEVVYGRSGQPLVLPLESDVDDLRAEVGAAGRYRLDPVDGANKPIANAAAGYVFVHDVAPAAPAGAAHAMPLPTPSDNVVVEALRMNAEMMRMNADMARSVVDRFPQMMEAAATLLRAADGAGLPSREPRAGEEPVEQDDEPQAAEPRPGLDLTAVLMQLVPVVVAAIGKAKPELSEVLDWRKATPAAKTAKAAAKAKAETAADVVPENATDVLPPIDPQTMAHFIAVQSALAPEEAAIAREVAKELSAGELRAWFDELSKLSVPDAVAKVRKLISGHGKSGGAS